MSRPWGRWRARGVRRSGERPASCLRSGQLRACALHTHTSSTKTNNSIREMGGSTNSDGRECLDSPLHTACDTESLETRHFHSHRCAWHSFEIATFGPNHMAQRETRVKQHDFRLDLHLQSAHKPTAQTCGFRSSKSRVESSQGDCIHNEGEASEDTTD